jgi:hypothetical protein
LLTTANTFTGGVQQITTASAATVGLIVKASASQSSNLSQNQSSAGTILSGVTAAGQTYMGSTSPILIASGGATTAATGNGTTATITTTSAHGLTVGELVTVAGVTPTGYNGSYLLTAVASNTISYLNSTTGAQTVAGTVSAPSQLSVTTRSTGTVGLILKRTNGQTATMARWIDENNGLLGFIGSDGGMTSYRGMYINPSSTSAVSLICQGLASQSADLQQWKSSSATLTAITAAGTINFASGNTSATANTGTVALPALAVGFITMQVAGTTVKVPYYAN